MAGATEAVVVLPPLPPEGGKSVSPMRTRICSGFSPNKSAAITAMTVLQPVPKSCVPQRISTLPSGLISASALVPLPPPPQVAPAQPTPVLIGPAELPGFLYFSFQPNFSAPRRYSFFRTSEGSFLMRSSTGSMSILAANSSMIDSMPKDAVGWPGARNARADPALTVTPACFTRVFGTV